MNSVKDTIEALLLALDKGLLTKEQGKELAKVIFYGKPKEEATNGVKIAK